MKNFEKKLSNLFDYQRFSKNKDLQRIINGVESRYESGSVLLSESELSFVAGGQYVEEEDKNKKNGQ